MIERIRKFQQAHPERFADAAASAVFFALVVAGLSALRLAGVA